VYFEFVTETPDCITLHVCWSRAMYTTQHATRTRGCAQSGVDNILMLWFSESIFLLLVARAIISSTGKSIIFIAGAALPCRAAVAASCPGVLAFPSPAEARSPAAAPPCSVALPSPPSSRGAGA